MNNKLAVLGAGESGVGAAILAKKKGFEVFVSDSGEIKNNYKKVLRHYELDFEEGKHSSEKILNAGLVIKSPGIPDSAPLVIELKKKIPVVSEIEFAGWYNKAKTICITGSNGKTTTTLLTYQILKEAGLNVGVAGNMGKSFARQVAEEDFDIYVIELSSFQLDGMFDFKADVAVLLNITPDHLDRYGYSMKNYVDSKFRVIQNQGKDDYFIYCSDDPVIQEERKKRSIKAAQLPFTLGNPIGEGAGIKRNEILIQLNQKQFSMSILDLSLQGKHNSYNSMAAGIAGMVFNIRNQQLRESLTAFKGVEHRLEHFMVVHGIEFINDSKATNVNSTWYALESIHKPVVWIAGGIDKGNNYSMLSDLIKSKVKAIVCLGKNNSKLHEAFDKVVEDIVDVYDMHSAVKSAYYLARNGDAVLLSPACASFDLFENYEDRGDQFKLSVREL
ncbi:MAG: UDP-N-acetylmuramoyl-L-alanine--D-glutamate ligase [Mariniphaga sp.]|nr:UDP-N-acetylmuramoyl-L-alanine--D-glutamate ligase [Mariniphaga sp.]